MNLERILTDHMRLLEFITNRSPSLRLGSSNSEVFEPLDRATYIEAFFDLVFVFCLHGVVSIITNVESGEADWYSYYTFCFTFALMLQIWFNSVIFMNRFGTGRVPDIVFLTTNMFLLLVMTQAISTSWENYLIYNICWVLIIINTIVHWSLRFLLIENPSPTIRRDTRMSIITLSIQAALVLLSHLMPSTPAQIVCLVAVLIGFAFWQTGGKDNPEERNHEHLAERCALLMVLTFGETLVTFGDEMFATMDLFIPILYFLLVVGMFLVYLNQIMNLVNLDRLGGGRSYMVLTGWLVFCIANATASFKMSSLSITLMGMSGYVYFSISVMVFLLSMFFFMPFTEYKQPKAKWMVARVIACLLVLLQIPALDLSPTFLIKNTSWSRETIAMVYILMSYSMTVIAVASVYAVLIIDRIAIRRERRNAANAESVDTTEVST